MTREQIKEMAEKALKHREAGNLAYVTLSLNEFIDLLCYCLGKDQVDKYQCYYVRSVDKGYKVYGNKEKIPSSLEIGSKYANREEFYNDLARVIKQSIIIGEFMNEDVAQRVCDELNARVILGR